MKKITIVFLMLVFAFSNLMAQPGGQRNFDPKERAQQTTERLKEALDLNKDQEKKVYEIQLKGNEKMAKMREEMQGGGGWEGMREKMTQFREEQNKEMQKVLTEGQWKKYEKYMEEQRSRREQGGGGRR